MSKLEEDLTFYANEAFTKRDAKAGFKLISEVVGIISLVGVAIWIVAVFLPGIGLPISGGIAAQGVRMLSKQYADLDEEERKQVRAAITWAKRGFDLFF